MRKSTLSSHVRNPSTPLTPQHLAVSMRMPFDNNWNRSTPLTPCSRMRMNTMGKVNESPGAGETGARGKVGVTGTRPIRGTATRPSRIVLDEITRLPRENCTKQTRNNEKRRKRIIRSWLQKGRARDTSKIPWHRAIRQEGVGPGIGPPCRKGRDQTRDRGRNRQ